MPEKITYRLFEESDLPGLLQLWAEETDWGAPTPEQWRRWYLGTPFGDAIIAVAVDESGAIAGQETFIPARVAVGDQVKRAWRLSAPILRRDLRHHSLGDIRHPTFRLYQTAIHSAAAQGIDLVYALPEVTWLPVFRVLARRRIVFFADAEYECLALPLAENFSNDGGSSLVIRSINKFEDEYAALWREAKQNFFIQCGVERSPEWLGYKNGAHLSFAAYDPDDTLTGYVAINRRTGLIADWLTRHPAQTADVLTAMIRHLATQRANGVRAIPDVLKAMKTSVLGDALQELGFVPIDFKFAFVCGWRDPNAVIGLSAENIKPEHWYLMPGD